MTEISPERNIRAPFEPRISVALVARHVPPAELEQVLRSLLNQSLAPAEILYLDNDSTNANADEAEKILSQGSIPFRLFRRSRNHMGEARQQALLECQSPWLLFLDSDCRPARDWLEQWSRHLDREGSRAAAWGAGNQPPPDHPFFVGWSLLSKEKVFHHGSAQARSSLDPSHRLHHVSSTHALYDVKKVLSIGGFSHERALSGEDLDLSFRLRKSGHELAWAPVTPLEHHLPQDLGTWLRKVFRYGQDQWPLLLRHGLRQDPRRSLFLMLGAFSVVSSFLFPPLLPLLLTAQFLWLWTQRPGFQAESWQGPLWVVMTSWIYMIGSVWGLVTRRAA